MNKPKLNERVLPVKWKHIIENEFTFRPTFVERLKILIGYNVELKYEAPVAHSPGAIKPSLSARVVEKL